MRKVFNNSTQPVSYKNRKISGYKALQGLNYGNTGLAFTKNYTVEKLHFTLLKRKLKLFLKSKDHKKYFKAWFLLSDNYPIFKKGKNARMGKGKGMYQRLSFRVKKNQTFLEFQNFNTLFVNKVSSMLRSNSNLNNKVIVNSLNYNLLIGQRNVSYYKMYRRF